MTRVAIAAEQAQGVELGKTANATPAASFGDPTPQSLSTSLRTLSFSNVMKELTASRVASETSSAISPELAVTAGKSPKATPWERLAVVLPASSGSSVLKCKTTFAGITDGSMLMWRTEVARALAAVHTVDPSVRAFTT
eukprot:scaffold760_cov307-Pinguiococcus_pyrenoidosus.AAC.1